MPTSDFQYLQAAANLEEVFGIDGILPLLRDANPFRRWESRSRKSGEEGHCLASETISKNSSQQEYFCSTPPPLTAPVPALSFSC